jgi:HAMP domain-containing protein
VPTHSAGTTGTTQPAAANAQVPVGAIVGAILGFMLLLSLGAAALFLCRRRAHRRDNKPPSLGSRTESAFIDLSVSEEELKPRPLILYDPERALATKKSPLPTSGNSSAPPTSPLGASVSTSDVQGRTAAMPKAAEVALANMAEEVQALRSQVRRLEQERAGIGAKPPSVEESPPQYAPG